MGNDADYLPYIRYPSVFFHLIQDSHYIVQELGLVTDILDEQILGHVSDVAY